MVTGGLLQQAFLLQIICRHALRILALHRNAGIQLLQRFFIEAGEDRLQPVGDLRLGLQHRLAHHRRRGIYRLHALRVAQRL